MTDRIAQIAARLKAAQWRGYELPWRGLPSDIEFLLSQHAKDRAVIEAQANVVEAAKDIWDADIAMPVHLIAAMDKALKSLDALERDGKVPR